VPFKGVQVDKVRLLASADIIDFKDAVYMNSKAALPTVIASELRVFRDCASYEENRIFWPTDCVPQDTLDCPLLVLVSQ
jgi:hypothetical protein